ncbi:hypothetical protein IWX90DRAFT_264672 [Phyllosticta citrichinensis]|uniref:Uncharacterized protein n=1 Tax=Phyllosticta citrichinensis TaxID=1130410 RepID=A0ABR1XM59_9PEZI
MRSGRRRLAFQALGSEPAVQSVLTTQKAGELNQNQREQSHGSAGSHVRGRLDVCFISGQRWQTEMPHFIGGAFDVVSGHWSCEILRIVRGWLPEQHAVFIVAVEVRAVSARDGLAQSRQRESGDAQTSLNVSRIPYLPLNDCRGGGQKFHASEARARKQQTVSIMPSRRRLGQPECPGMRMSDTVILHRVNGWTTNRRDGEEVSWVQWKVTSRMIRDKIAEI